MSKLPEKSILEDANKSDRVLDMGTECGVNAILAASKSTNAVAVDMDPNAVEVGKRNAKRNDVADRIEFIQRDLFENVERNHRLDESLPKIYARWHSLTRISNERLLSLNSLRTT